MKKTVSLFAFAILLGVFLLTTPSCTTSTKTSVELSLDTLVLADLKMQAYIDEGKLAGISTLVLKDGELAHRGSFGWSNIEEERAMTEDAIFRIYSMSKPITAAALMVLFDEGKFQLDDPVENYIPVFKDTKVWEDGEEVDQAQPFTVRQLLTHTAGFCYGWGESYVDSLYRSAKSDEMWGSGSLELWMKYIAGVPLKNQPGSKYEYSISVDLAGYLVEILSGMPFDVFLQNRIFEPLGMDDTGFSVPEEKWDRLAMIYTTDWSTGNLKPVEGFTNEVKKNVTLFSGGGGMVSTIDDYGKFGQMLLNGGELNGIQVLEESTVKLITTNQMLPPATFEKGRGYGLGGYVDLETEAYGWSGMASTDFLLDIENNMVVLSYAQYFPTMGVPYARLFKDYVERANITKE